MSDHVIIDETGMFRKMPDTSGMLVPVQCSWCGGVYDLCNTVPITRYTDCTTYMTPCCDRLADDRQGTFRPDFKYLR